MVSSADGVFVVVRLTVCLGCWWVREVTGKKRGGVLKVRIPSLFSLSFTGCSQWGSWQIQARLSHHAALWYCGKTSLRKINSLLAQISCIVQTNTKAWAHLHSAANLLEAGLPSTGEEAIGKKIHHITTHNTWRMTFAAGAFITIAYAWQQPILAISIFIYLGFVRCHHSFLCRSPQDPLLDLNPNCKYSQHNGFSLDLFFLFRPQVYFLKPRILLNPPFRESPIIVPTSYTSCVILISFGGNKFPR